GGHRNLHRRTASPRIPVVTASARFSGNDSGGAAHAGGLYRYVRAQAGRVLVCPGSRHMTVRRLSTGDVVVLNDEAPVNGHRPSVDVLFRSVAKEYGRGAVAVLMTGMGEDGAQGLGEVKKAGGMTIAQSEESCVVFGMPKAAIERGYATRVVALDVLSSTLQAICGRNEGQGNNGGGGKALRAGR